MKRNKLFPRGSILLLGVYAGILFMLLAVRLVQRFAESAAILSLVNFIPAVRNGRSLCRPLSWRTLPVPAGRGSFVADCGCPGNLVNPGHASLPFLLTLDPTSVQHAAGLPDPSGACLDSFAVLSAADPPGMGRLFLYCAHHAASGAVVSVPVHFRTTEGIPVLPIAANAGGIFRLRSRLRYRGACPPFTG